MLHQIGPNFLEFGIDRGLETLAILSTLVMFLLPLMIFSLSFYFHTRSRSSARNVGRRVERFPETAPGQAAQEETQEEYRHAA